MSERNDKSSDSQIAILILITVIAVGIAILRNLPEIINTINRVSVIR